MLPFASYTDRICDRAVYKIVTMPRHLLVVDDEPLLARATSRLFRAYRITIANNVEEAKQILLSSDPVDGVLSDVMMPDGTGLDLFAWVRKQVPALEDRFILMTGGVPANLLDALVQVSAPVLSKPVDTQELRQLVEEKIGAAEDGGGTTSA